MSSDKNTSTRDPSPLVPPGVSEFLAFFRSELRDVVFPDLDGSRLDHLEQAVTAAQERFVDAQAGMEDARRGLAEALKLLEGDARRALAYARIYAEAKPDLGKRLAQLQLGKRRPAAKKAPLRRKGALHVAPAADGQA